MTFAPFRIGTKPIFDYLKFLDISQIFQMERGKFVFKSNNGLLPIDSIAQHFVRNNAAHRYNLRNGSHRLLITPIVLLSSYKQKSLYIRGNNMWGNIPEALKLSDSLNIFKRDFKAYILNEHT